MHRFGASPSELLQTFGGPPALLMRETQMATTDRPSQGYLRELANLPPAIRGPKLERSRERASRPQPFSMAEPRGTKLDRLLAGTFHRRLVFLLGAVLVTIFIVTVAT
jgi:hypothetical protein